MVIVTLGLVLAVILAAAFLMISVVGHQVESPTVRRLSALTDREINLDFTPTHFGPYQFLIGVRGASPACPSFDGELTISGPDGKETEISIDSITSQESNWLRDPSEKGYILTWGKQPSLDEVLVRGDSYRVRFRFEESLPDGCSLWFSSMRHIPILGKEKP